MDSTITSLSQCKRLDSMMALPPSKHMGNTQRPSENYFFEPLTPAENKVLLALKADPFKTNAHLAESLHISVNTVKTHLKSVYKKMGESGPNSRFRVLGIER